MKAKLIIVGWLLALLLTTYTGANLLVWAGIISLMWGCTYLMNRYKDEVEKEVDRFEKQIDKLIKNKKQ